MKQYLSTCPPSLTPTQNLARHPWNRWVPARIGTLALCEGIIDPSRQNWECRGRIAGCRLTGALFWRRFRGWYSKHRQVWFYGFLTCLQGLQSKMKLFFQIVQYLWHSMPRYSTKYDTKPTNPSRPYFLPRIISSWIIYVRFCQPSDPHPNTNFKTLSPKVRLWQSQGYQIPLGCLQKLQVYRVLMLLECSLIQFSPDSPIFYSKPPMNICEMGLDVEGMAIWEQGSFTRTAGKLLLWLCTSAGLLTVALTGQWRHKGGFRLS